MRSKALGLILIALLLGNGALAAGQAQTREEPSYTFKTLHSFTGGNDGCGIYGGLARDRSGSLYGVAYLSDCYSGGSVLFKLTHTKQGYRFRVLETFSSVNRLCDSTPAVDKAGNVFGVCKGGVSNEGTLWEYSSKGKLTVLHSFNGPGDGMEPEDSVVLDASGNIYGTTYTWGPGGSGTLWEYSPSSKSFKLLHGFSDGDDGGLLPAGPNVDPDGVVWGTTEDGPNCYYCGDGTAWNYDPSSGTFTTVVDFNSTGILAPQSRTVFGKEGNVFGTAFGTSGGYNNCGLVYELQKANNYAPVVAYPFTGGDDGCLTYGRVRLDKHGHFLGTTYSGGSFGGGTVYELIHKNGAWQETTLHSFNYSDGSGSQAGMVTDHKGSWFGTTSGGGKYGWGTVFEISGVK